MTSTVNPDSMRFNLLDTETAGGQNGRAKKIRLTIIVTAVVVAALMVIHHIYLLLETSSLHQDQSSFKAVPSGVHGSPELSASALPPNDYTHSFNLSKDVLNRLDQVAARLDKVETKIGYFLPPADKRMLLLLAKFFAVLNTPGN